MTDYQKLFQNFRQLFTSSFITNCHLDDASLTQQESTTLKQLDPDQVFQNFKDLLSDLLSQKRQSKTLDTHQLKKQSRQLQAQLQKLQGQVRTHIRVQHQLKLHIQSAQSKLDKSEQIKQNLQSKISQLQNQIQPENFRSFNNLKEKKTSNIKKKIRQEFQSQIESLEKLAANRARLLEKVQFNNTQLKQNLSQKQEELESVKRELARKTDRKQGNLGIIRKKIDAKTSQICELQPKMRISDTKIPVKITRQKLKNARRSMQQARNTPSPFGIREPSKHRPLSRQHMRSVSERFRTSKRTPSRQQFIYVQNLLQSF